MCNIFVCGAVGGTEKLRDYWRMYLGKARVMVFVVDSADPERFPLAKRLLHQLLSADPCLPLVLLANKQVRSVVHALCNPLSAQTGCVSGPSGWSDMNLKG